MAQETPLSRFRLFKDHRRRMTSPSSRRQPRGRHALIVETLEHRITLSADPVLMVVGDQAVAEGTELSIVDIGIFTDVVEGGGSSIGLNPCDFTSLGSFDPVSSVLIDSTTLSMTGGFMATGVTTTVSGVEIAVFTFTDFELDAGISITGTGSRPLALLSQTDVWISGTIDVSATRTNRGDSEPGPGGGAGGELADGAPFDGFPALGAPATASVK